MREGLKKEYKEKMGRGMVLKQVGVFMTYRGGTMPRTSRTKTQEGSGKKILTNTRSMIWGKKYSRKCLKSREIDLLRGG